MIIVYCETCGVRVSEEAVHSGQAAVAGPNKYYCDKCAPASSPAMNRKSPGGSNRLAALMQKAAAVPPAASNSRNRAGKTEKPSDPAWMYIAGGVVLIAGAVYFFMAARPQNNAAKNPKPSPKTESVSTSGPNKTPGTLTPPPADSNAKAEPKSLARIQQSDPDLDNLRNQRGMKLVEEARAWAKANPDDPWGYKDRLTMIVNVYRSTPAAEEAAKILMTLKVPDGPRPTGTAAPVEVMPNPFPPSVAAEGWQPIFDGKTIPFRTVDTWRIEGGALVAQGRVHPQTLFTFADGTVRLRLVLQEASYCEILVRQSTHGYGVSMDRRVLEPLWGKPMELIFSCKGPDVTATLNGQPVEVKSGQRPEKGHIQINNVNGTTRVFGLDYRAATK